MNNSYEVGTYLVHLLKSVLNDTQPNEKPENISFSDILAMAKFHSLLSMTYLAFIKLKNPPEKEVMEKLKKNHDLMVMKAITQDAEKEILLDALHEQGIYTLPVKGFYLQNMYPELGMREMADLDILIDRNKVKESKKVMQSLDYETTSFDSGNHDTYQKKPFMDVELHRFLVPLVNPAFEYYTHIMDKAIKEEEYSYHLSWSDHYIFNVVHYAKHYLNGGSGIRSVMDFYVFLKAHGEELNRSYIQEELTKLGLFEFSQWIEKMVGLWFGEEEDIEEMKESEEYIFSCGTYGTIDHVIQKKLSELYKEEGNKKKVKRKYLFRRLFPPYKQMCQSYHCLRVLPILLPFCYLIRLFKGVLFRRKYIRAEMRSLDRY